MDFDTKYYTVRRIDGDYAYLETLNRPDLEEKCVARALLPADISEGAELKYEMFEYSPM